MKKGLRCALSLVLVMATLFSVFGGVLVYAEDLAAIGADFNSIVESIDDSSGLVEKKEKIDLAEVKLGQYTAAGGAYTDALIADAYAEYLLKKDAVEKTIADCLEFIRIVEMAQGEELSYPEVRAYLDEAKGYVDKIDTSYTGVSMAYQTYGVMLAELEEPEKNCAMFIDMVNAALATTDYASGKRAYELANDAQRLVEIDDYPGIEKAKADLAAFKSKLDLIKFRADTYIVAVENLSSAPSMLKAIADAKAMEATVDFTVPGASDAKANLAAFESSYDECAKQANADVDDMNSFIFGFWL